MSHTQSGKLIVLEGIDGAGKSTQIRLLAEKLNEAGYAVKSSREPTYGPHGTRLRESAETGRLDPEQELELFLLDRRQHVEELIAPALAAGEIVLLDRYYFSNMVYQSLRGLDLDEIRQRNEAFAPRPDLLIIVDLDVEKAHERISARGDVANAFEQLEALRICRERFLSFANEDFATVIDGNQQVEEVHVKIWTRTQAMLDLSRKSYREGGK